MDVIKAGDVVIIQRMSHLRVATLNPLRSTIHLSRDVTLDLAAVLGHPFESSFKMEPDNAVAESRPKGGKVWRLSYIGSAMDLEEQQIIDGIGQDPDEPGHGEDNRHLTDDSSSQRLTRLDIEDMKEQGVAGHHIMQQLIKNSDSFSTKTRFSQVKFVRKKAEKYFYFITIRKPSIRLLAHIYYSADPMKVLNLRIDSLAQMLNMANVRAGCKYLVYETGCQGLLVAAVLERLIADDRAHHGRLIHLFQTGCPQTQAVNAMNFNTDQLDQCLSTLNIYHLRSLETGVDLLAKQPQPDAEGVAPPPRQKLREASVRSYQVISDRNMDGLLIACKQHPTSLLLFLIKYLAPSRPFVVFSPYKECLMDTYMAIKDTGRAVMVMLTESWLRSYQVLPDRTHPEVTMSGGGGYLLSGIYVDKSPAANEASVEESASNKKGRRL